MKILIVEDQAMLRESLSLAIGSQEDMQVVGSIADARDAMTQAKRTEADMILMDVCTENDSSGIAACRKIKAQMPQIRVVIMTGMPEMTFLRQAKDAGADSFAYKNMGTQDLLNVIRSTAEGYSTFPADTNNEMDGIKLTEEEMQILRLVCEAKGRKEIAEALYMSEGTVKRRISEILAKTGYRSILKLAVHAVSNGYIVPRVKNDEQQ